MKLLADTSALLAVFDQRDQHHVDAVEFRRRNPQARFVVTELVLGELATRLRARSDAEGAAAIVTDLLESQHQVIFVDPQLFREALATMRKLVDKQLSLTDCASFVVMQRLELRQAFTFDRDFRDCGYEMVP